MRFKDILTGEKIGHILGRYVLLFGLSLLVSFVLKQIPWFGKFYQTVLFPILTSALRTVFSLINFSVSEWLIVLAVTGLIGLSIYGVIKVRRIHFRSWLRNSLRSLLLIYWAYMFCWGFGYAFPSNIDRFQTSGIPGQELEKMAETLISDCNMERLKFNGYDTISIASLLKHSSEAYTYNGRSLFGGAHFSGPAVKPVVASKLMSYLGLSGIYFPFTAEANVNVSQPGHAIPFSACHEIAHQLGYNREDEANCIGFLTAYSSPKPEIKYSALFSALNYVMTELYFTDTAAFSRVRQRYGPGLMHDIRVSKDYWWPYSGRISEISENVNHVFLIGNDQEEGTESYNDFVYFLHYLYRHKIRGKATLRPDLIE